MSIVSFSRISCLLLLFCSCAPVHSPIFPLDEPKDPKSDVTTQVPVIPSAISEVEDNYIIPEIAIDSGINDDLANTFVNIMGQLDATGKVHTVVVEINTDGGSVEAGMKMVKAMERSRMRSVCVVSWRAYSMGASILQGCTIRLTTKEGVIMVHNPSIQVADFTGNSIKYHNIGNNLEATLKSMLEHLTKKTKMKPEDLMKHIDGGREWWLNWKESIEVGLVDGWCESTEQVLASLRDTNKVPYSKK